MFEIVSDFFHFEAKKEDTNEAEEKDTPKSPPPEARAVHSEDSSDDEDFKPTGSPEDVESSKEEEQPYRPDNTSIEALVEELENFKIEDEQIGAMKLHYLHFIYTWDDEDGWEHVTVEFLVNNMNRKNFLPKVEPSGRYLALETTVPEFFISGKRVTMAQKRAKTEQTKKNKKAQGNKVSAFEKAARDFRASYDHEKIKVTQRVKLPFKVKRDF